jgi:hypothetical protein
MTVNSTKDPIVLTNHFFTQWENEEINTLPKRQKKAFSSVIRKGIPLNKRMRRIWHDVQMFANANEMSNWLAENDSWGME